MQLTLDLGNSALKGGLFDGDRLVRTLRIPLDHEIPLENAVAERLREVECTKAGLVSVVPDLNERVVRAVSAATGVAPHVFGVETPLPFRLAYETPGTLGIDRLAAAAAGWTRHGLREKRDVVVVDAGTAITYEVIDQTATYQGGVIAPGPELTRTALAEGTAQLQRVSLDLPDEPVGRTSERAMQSGIMYGFLDSVAGMLSRLTGPLEDPFVVATGGWAPILRRAWPARIDLVEPHLVLYGVHVLLAARGS